jgi:hypothetical protein
VNFVRTLSIQLHFLTLQLNNTQYNQFTETTIFFRESLNLTLDYNSLKVTGDAASANEVITFPFGFLLSSTNETFVYAIKADQGTTDGYLIPVLTNHSREFFLAGWP